MKTRVRNALCGVAAAALVMAVTAACASQTEKAASTPSPVETTAGQETPIGMPNPASVYCIDRGGELETLTDVDGNETGTCIFPDGTEKEEWEYWYENHPAQAAAGSIADYARPTVAPSGTPQIVRQVSAEESEKLARGFVRDSRTFESDGNEESLKLVETLQARCPGCWAFVYTFDSRHAGYGDRSDQMLAQVITLHKASVMVEQGKVVKAILDDEWDMMAQEMVQ